MTSDPLFTGPELCGLEAHEIVTLLKAKEISSAEPDRCGCGAY
jgi:hypothetical protein